MTVTPGGPRSLQTDRSANPGSLGPAGPASPRATPNVSPRARRASRSAERAGAVRAGWRLRPAAGRGAARRGARPCRCERTAGSARTRRASAGCRTTRPTQVGRRLAAGRAEGQAPGGRRAARCWEGASRGPFVQPVELLEPRILVQLRL